jgi:FAD/FMN-containing dehydrogenase
MTSRREFLEMASLAAVWPQVALAQAKPKGILVNDLHSQLNATRVHRIVEPEMIDAVRGALKLARGDGRAVCIVGGRHAMGGQQFATDGVLIDVRRLNKVLAFDAGRGLIEVESGMQWPQLLEHLMAFLYRGVSVMRDDQAR